MKKKSLCSLWKKSAFLFTYKNYSRGKSYSGILLSCTDSTVYTKMFIP